MTEADVIHTQTISLAAAQRVADAAIASAQSQGVAACIAIVDPGGHPVVTIRMDGAPRLSADIALNKAHTVTAFNGMPTGAWWPAIADDPALVHGITHTPRLIIFGGGVPIKVGGALAGAIGVSGGSTDQDMSIAEAAAAAVS